MLTALGAKVQSNMSARATHFVSAGGRNKRLTKALESGLACVSEEWIERYGGTDIETEFYDSANFVNFNELPSSDAMRRTGGR